MPAPKPTKKQPIFGLEALRGACALGVAIYHCAAWTGLAELYSWGVYGVYVFFVISGAVMYYNYHGMGGPGGISIPAFLYKRFVRLAPLFAVCVVLSAILIHQWPAARLMLNASLLFGFADPGSNSMVAGGWSLGIEFVLYALFPVMLAFLGSTRLLLGAFLTLLVLRIVSTNIALDGRTVIDGWSAYTQPGAFFVFFFGGMVLAKWNGFRYQAALALAAIPVFAMVGQSEEAILRGLPGVLYTLAGIALVAGFFWSPRGAFALAVCRFLGDTSYGLYLLHPIVWAVVHKFGANQPVALQIAATLVVSMAGAWCSLYLFERPIKYFLLGRRGLKPALSTENTW